MKRIFRSEPVARRRLFVAPPSRRLSCGFSKPTKPPPRRRRYKTTALAAFFGGLLGNAQDLHMYGAFARAIQLG